MVFCSSKFSRRRFLPLVPHPAVLTAFAVVAACVSISLSKSAYAAVAVGAGGQASYSIPIVVPPGVSGMAPNLSLSYTDGGLNGPLGVGWSVQGISTITRCGATKATDNFSKPVNFSMSDKLCLDGQRLIPTSADGTPLTGPTNDASGALANAFVQEFRTEKDSFARIRAYGAVGNSTDRGPAYFKVWTKSGQVYEYGLDSSVSQNSAASADSANAAQALILAQPAQMASPPPPPAMVWAVRRIVDTATNAIEFRYRQRSVAWGSGGTASLPGKEWNIDEIRYTANSAAPKNKVMFYYEDRPDTAAPSHDRAEAYQLDRKNVSVQRLMAIRTCVNLASADQACPTAGQSSGTAVPVRVYKVAYDRGPNSGRSRMTSVTECVGSREAQCLPPTTFSYTSNASLLSFSTVWAFDTSGMGAEKLIDSGGGYGTLTGDFDGDGKTDIIRWSNNPAENKMFLSLGGGQFGQQMTTNLTSVNLFKSDGCYSSIIADFNGDGLSDILRTAKTSCSGSLGNVLYLSLGNGSFSAVAVNPNIDLEQIQARAGWRYAFCPEEGMRSSSRAVASPGDNNFSSTSNFLSTSPGAREKVNRPPGNCVQLYRNKGKRYYIMDVNADGIPDIVTTVAVPYAMDSGAMMPTEDDLCAGVGASPAFSGPCARVFVGDSSGNFSEFGGTSLANHSVYSHPPANYRFTNPYWRIPDQADLNGDGLQDILALNTGRWLSLGNGNFEPSPAASDNSQLCGLPIDFNGDGRTDCLVPDASPSSQKLMLSYGAASSGAIGNFNISNNLYAEDANGFQTIGVVVDDFDGDGRQDILRWGPTDNDVGIYFSRGDGSFSPRTSAGLNSISRPLQSADGTTAFVLGDFLGTGALQILHMKHDPTGSGATLDKHNQLYARSGAAPNDVLASVTTSTGLVTTIGVRESLTNSSQYIAERGTPEAGTGSVVDLRPPMYVITSVSAQTGVDPTPITTAYRYKGLKAERGGRGLLGFHEVRQQAPSSSGGLITTATQYVQKYPYIGVAASSQTYLGSLALEGQILSSTVNAYCDKTSSDAVPTITPSVPYPLPCSTVAKVQRPYLAQTVERGWDLNNETIALPTVITTNSYNNSGDPLTILVETSGSAFPGVSQPFLKTTTNVYKADATSGDSWILGRLERASVQNTVPNSRTSIAASAGTSPNATANAGSGPAPVSAGLPPGVLSAILQLLLDD